MTPEQWQRVKEALAQAQALAGEARAVHLAGLEPGVRAEVEALLAADERQAGGLEGGALPAGVSAEAWVGRRLGPYEVTGVLGEGGMGVVYRARRADGAFERDVAVKVLRRSLLAPQFLERFQLERQILARLEHPAIARLLDGGQTAEGDPWLAMELVEGARIDQYCVQQGLPQERRIALFREVCAAVQYAHANLVVHRDLKPSNILVGADGRPKLLDFGIARPLDDTGPEQTRHTALPVMTLEYASPEQLRGERVTTASDVYSLGVILCVLLTGRHPYRTRDATTPELIRAISEGDAQRTGLGADLDAIVLKAMRRDPAERYATPERLADDLRRHAEGLPVTARPGTRGYLVRKFVRRHAWGVGLAAAATIVLVGGLVAIALLNSRLRAAATETASALAESKAVADFLEHDMLDAADPHVTGSAELHVKDVLTAASRKVDQRFAGQPLLAAAVHRALGQSWAGAGDLAHADGDYQAALDLLKGRSDARSRALWLETLNAMAQDHYNNEEYAKAAQLLDQAWPFKGQPLSPPERDQRWLTMAIIGSVQAHQGDAQAGLAMIEQAVREATAAKGPRDDLTLMLRDSLVANLGDAGVLDRAEKELRSLVADVGPDGKGPISSVGLRDKLAATLFMGGKNEEAVAIAAPLYAEKLKLFGPGSAEALHTGNTLAAAYDNLGQRDRAAILYRELLAAAEKAFGPDSDVTLGTRGNLAVLYQGMGRWQDSIDLERASLATYERTGRGGTRAAILSLRAMARSQMELGQWEEAEKGTRRARELARKGLAADDVIVRVIDMEIAAEDLHFGRKAEAVKLLEQVTPELVKQLGTSHKVTQRLAAIRAQAGLPPLPAD